MKKLKLTKVIAGSLIVASVLALNPIGASAEWKNNSTGWWYTEGSSWATGWRLIDKNWYYFYSDGYMARNNKIDGYFVNSGGAWTDSITANEARELILNEDGNYISKVTNNYTRLSTDYREYSSQDMPTGNAWNVPKEPCYDFSIYAYDNNGEIVNACCEYLVGKNSKNVYVMWNQGNSSVYQIENNQKVKTFKWIKVGESYEWRK